MARWLMIALIAATVVAAAGPANADHVAGVRYKGGNDAGGIVEFTVSEDSSSVLDFRYTALPELCSMLTEAVISLSGLVRNTPVW